MTSQCHIFALKRFSLYPDAPSFLWTFPTFWKIRTNSNVTYADPSVESLLVCPAVSQQIAKLRLQLQRSKQVSRQSKDREQSSLQLSQQAQHGNACTLQVSLRPVTERTYAHARMPSF